MIALENVTLRFGHKVLIENACVEFADGQLTALTGRNGSGKSTLLRTMASLNRPASGTVTINGHDVGKTRAGEMARLMAFVTTERLRVANLTAEELVALGRAPYTDWLGNMTSDDRAKVMESLALVGMADMARRAIDTMSDGERQRVMIARALAQDTPVILLDEPTSFLDLPNRYEIVELLGRLAREKNKTIVFSTHELDIALRMTHSVALIGGGTLHHLPAAEMAASGLIEKYFGEITARHLRTLCTDSTMPQDGMM